MASENQTSVWMRLLNHEVLQILWVVGAVFGVCLLLMRVVEGDLTAQHVSVALGWTQMLFGMVALLAGGQQAVRAYRLNQVTSTGLTEITPGVVTALVGASLLGAGDWGAPVALGIVGVMHLGAQIAGLRAGAAAPAKSAPKKPAAKKTP